MFYLANIHLWLDEVVRTCNDKQLDPNESTFMLVTFTSLDSDYVRFFSKMRKQISSYAGQNFHIFTPIIYDKQVIPDAECRHLREDLERNGISIGNRPGALLFRLERWSQDTGFKPLFFAAYQLTDFATFEYHLRDVIDASIRYRGNDGRLSAEISRALSAPSILQHPVWFHSGLGDQIGSSLSLPTVFVSHSSQDKPFVRVMVRCLSAAGVHAWIDEVEIQPGCNIQQTIAGGIRSSDFLIVVLSQHSVRSDWVRFELAQFMGKMAPERILPVLRDDTRPGDLPSPFQSLSGVLHLDFGPGSDWNGNMDKLISRITQAR